MKFSKLMNKLNDLFGRRQREQKIRRKDLKMALKKIRHKQRELEQRLQTCDSELEAGRLKEKISILQAQRAKGVAFLKEMKKSKD
ncbi:MAG: hypothetical protein CMI02_20140 [Oceanospirillaceae bacterium]|nr:hypothetical protein [Oceanospirillaceae bacterium]MBT14340.1 hypothetical protein [Oceanospirillaceae bacterium]|tara:strand:- start:104122 stop:104376 length:255 start_codon:yes stop_codon:yes gene_type:complete